MSWYRHQLAEGQTFRCSSCGRIKRVKYVPTSNLCRSCAAKKRHTVPNVPVSIADNLVVTTVVEKRLHKRAEKDIPRTRADRVGSEIQRWVFVFFFVSAFFVIPRLFSEFSGGMWLFALGWCLGLPAFIDFLVIEQILARPRRERQEQVALRTRELAEEREKRQEEGQLFYSSPEWAKLREWVIKEEGRVCAQCRRHIKNDSDVTIDHIRPRSKYPHLALRRENLRVLCRKCNSRKKDRESLDL